MNWEANTFMWTCSVLKACLVPVVFYFDRVMDPVRLYWHSREPLWPRLIVFWFCRRSWTLAWLAARMQRWRATWWPVGTVRLRSFWTGCTTPRLARAAVANVSSVLLLVSVLEPFSVCRLTRTNARNTPAGRGQHHPGLMVRHPLAPNSFNADTVRGGAYSFYWLHHLSRLTWAHRTNVLFTCARRAQRLGTTTASSGGVLRGSGVPQLCAASSFPCSVPLRVRNVS